MKLTIEVPTRVYKLLKDFAEENGRSVDKIVQKAIEDLIVDIESLKEAMLAYSEYKNSGEKSIPFDKVMEKLGLSDDLLEKELEEENSNH